MLLWQNENSFYHFYCNFATEKSIKYNIMEEIILRNEYRCLHDGEKSEWKQLTSIGEFIWDGVYAIRLVMNDGSLDLPFKFSGEEVVNLLVNDQFPDNHIQNNRIIVQTLNRVDKATGDVLTYTRSRRYSNGEHKWSEWVANNGKNGISIVEQSDNSVNIKPNVLNLWGEVESLEITLAQPDDVSIVNEYMIQFTSGDVATTLILPSEIKWMSTPIIQANKVYQISIVNNLAVMGEFCNE